MLFNKSSVPSTSRSQRPAGGPQTLSMATQVLRDAIADGAVDDPTAIDILESLSHDERDDIANSPSNFDSWLNIQLARVQVASP
jgi:hypothetical protein